MFIKIKDVNYHITVDGEGNPFYYYMGLLGIAEHGFRLFRYGRSIIR